MSDANTLVTPPPAVPEKRRTLLELVNLVGGLIAIASASIGVLAFVFNWVTDGSITRALGGGFILVSPDGVGLYPPIYGTVDVNCPEGNYVVSGSCMMNGRGYLYSAFIVPDHKERFRCIFREEFGSSFSKDTNPATGQARAVCARRKMFAD